MSNKNREVEAKVVPIFKEMAVKLRVDLWEDSII